MNKVILDVRENDEFESEHIQGSIHMPLSRLAWLAPGILSQLENRSLVLMCRSGMRAQTALNQLDQLGYPKSAIEVYAGGILEWKRQGNPTVVQRHRHFPLMRQVQLIAGSAILVFILLGVFIRPELFWGAAAVGMGLTLAGLTGYCGLAQVLSVMPWNQTRFSGKKSATQAKSDKTECSRSCF